MLTKRHIECYKEEVAKAEAVALKDIHTAEAFAKHMNCPGCRYCESLTRHKELLGRTVLELTLLIQSLREGLRPSNSFPKKMYPNATLYRGFITKTGEYIHLEDIGHSEFREQYASQHGEDEAWQMINVHNRGWKTQIQFFDRKNPPNTMQLVTLRELLIDAEGALSFGFLFDTNHPSS